MDWYTNDVKDAISKREKCVYKPKTIFYGSSSIRLWNSLYQDFELYKPVNLGFGGSTLEACTVFFEAIVAPVQSADTFFLYAGDNDLGDGKRPEDVLFFFTQFMNKLRKFFPTIKFYYISIKPSLSRNNIIDKIVLSNNLIKNEIGLKNSNNQFVNVYSEMLNANAQPNPSLFEEDGLHLNEKGYAIWKETILRECFLK